MLILFLAATGSWAEEAVFPKEAQELLVKAASLKSYRTRFVIVAEEEGEPIHLEGRILFEAPNRRRIELKEGPSPELSQLLVSDGQAEWQFYPELATVYRSQTTPEAPGPHRPFNEVQEGTLRFIEERGEGSEAKYRFEATPLPAIVEGSPVAIDLLRIDVGKKDGLVRGMYLVDDKGQVILSQEYTEVEVDVPISKEEFIFVPPTGVSVVEMEPTGESSQ